MAETLPTVLLSLVFGCLTPRAVCLARATCLAWSKVRAAWSVIDISHRNADGRRLLLRLCQSSAVRSLLDTSGRDLQLEGFGFGSGSLDTLEVSSTRCDIIARLRPQTLTLHNFLGDEDLAMLLQNPNLVSLAFHCEGISRLDLLGSAPGLRSLRLMTCPRLDMPALVLGLCGCGSHLRRLSIGLHSPDLLPFIAELCPALEDLDLSFEAWSAAARTSPSWLGSLRCLRSFRLKGGRRGLVDQCLKELARPGCLLEKLDLGREQVTDQGCRFLANALRLRELQLDCTHLESIAWISQLPALERITLGAVSKEKSSELACFGRLQRLQSVVLGGFSAGTEHMGLGIRLLDVKNFFMDSLVSVLVLTTLRELSISMLTDGWLWQIASCLRDLRVLRVYSANMITNDGLLRVVEQGLRKLRGLWLFDDSQSLSISDACLPALCNLVELEELTLEPPCLSQPAIAALWTALPSLCTLETRATRKRQRLPLEIE